MRRLLVVMFAALLCLLPAGALADDPTPESGITMPPSNNTPWVLTPNLGPDATQTDYGAEIYRLVCKACHGDKGQGLTPDWIAQWAPEDQNCWQSKCHALNHPPDGFVLPHDIPPVVGASVTNRFVSAEQLHSYIAATMPWHAPGRLTSDEYWQVTAYLLEQNGVKLAGATLDADNAAAFKMTGGAETQSTPTTPKTQQPPGAVATRQAERAADLAAQEAARSGWPWGWIVLLPLSVLGVFWVFATALRQI